MPGGERSATFSLTRNRGLVSNQSAHDADPRSFVTYTDVVNDVAGRIRKRPGIGVPVGASSAYDITAIHEFRRVDPSTGDVTSYIFRASENGIFHWTGGTWAGLAMGASLSGAGAWVFYNYNNRCFASNGTDALLVFDGSTGPTGWRWYTVGVDAPTVAATYSLAAAFNTGTVTATKGDATVTGTIGPIWNVAWAGKKIDVNGIRYTIASVTTAGNGTSIAPVLELTEKFKETGASGFPYVIYTGLMDWAEPPKYRYAYYNPTTGHCSLPSPLTEITEKDQVGCTPTINGILHSADAYNNGYTEIKLFRTARNAAILVAINVTIANSNDVDPPSFTETAATYLDVHLTAQEVPVSMNAKPPSQVISIGSWDSRLWLLTRVGRLYYSARPEDLVGSLGVAEECFPAHYNKFVTGGAGLLPIGAGDDVDMLLVQTFAGDCTVIGYNHLTYRIRKLPTRDSSGHIGGAVSVSGALVQLYRDKRLFDYGKGVDIGMPIQDHLNAIIDIYWNLSRMVWFSDGARNYLVLSIAKTGAVLANNAVFIFDYDMEAGAGVWYEWNLPLGFQAFGIVHYNDKRELWVAMGDGNVYRLFQPGVFTDNGANIVPTIKSAHFRSDGVLARLKYLRASVSDVTQALVGVVYIEEETSVDALTKKSKNVAFYQAPVEFRDAANALVYQPEATLEGRVVQFAITFPTIAGDYYIERLDGVVQSDAEAGVDL